MYPLLANLKEYFKKEEVTTDNAIFRLHYLFTSIMLIAFSVIITATQFVGNPISCIVDKGYGDQFGNVINTYCWITSTFTLPDAFRRQVGKEIAHPGVGNQYQEYLESLHERKMKENQFEEEGATKYYTYYQWVVFVLFLQAILCYTPKCIWDVWEGGLMKSLVMALSFGMSDDRLLNQDLLVHGSHIQQEKQEDMFRKKKALLEYLQQHLKHHDMYAFKYWLCEALCLANIVGQLHLMDTFFDGEFFTYGTRVLDFAEMEQEERVDPMVYVFPRVTKCTFHKFGSSGTIQKHDTLCILPLNIVNEKTFIFVWFWFIILATLLSGLLIYRAIILAVPTVRPKLLWAQNRVVPEEAIEVILKKANVGDWWLLYMLSVNLDPIVYREIIADLSKGIETNGSNYS